MVLSSTVIAAVAAKGIWWKYVHRFGALLFLPFALWDNSPIPSLGGVDALLIVLATSNHELWWEYALIATVCSIVAAYPMYRVGAKSGEKALDEKLGAKRAKKIRDTFQKHGFWSLFVGAIAPPPIPTAAFIGTAGAMKYSRRNFFIAIASGRLLRFVLIGWVAAHYGRHIFQFFAKFKTPAIWTLTAIGVIGGIVAVYYWRRARSNRKAEERNGVPATPQPNERAA